MTAYSMTVNNSIRSFGIGPAAEWGDMVWGTDNWGEGNDPVETIKWTTIGINNTVNATSEVIRSVQKLLTNSITPSSDVIRIFYRLLDGTIGSTSEVIRTPTKLLDSSIASTSEVLRTPYKLLANTMTCAADNISEKIYDRAGYVNDWPGGMQDAEERVFDTWSEDSDASTTFTEDADPTTSWSDA